MAADLSNSTVPNNTDSNNTGLDKLVWLDLEMSGLDPLHDRILEVAAIVTDSQLTVLSEGPLLAIHQPESCLSAMGEWCQRTHMENGLLERVRHSSITEELAEELMLSWLANWVPVGVAPLCGNSIGQDRQFLQRYMPKLAAYFHYRSIDVSSLKELARRWNPAILAGFTKRNTHRALDDIRESIAELVYYRRYFIR